MGIITQPAIKSISTLLKNAINPRLIIYLYKGNISCYILLLNSPLTLENTKFIAGGLSLMVSLVLYLPIGHYES
jgi:hypothetical protein